MQEGHNDVLVPIFLNAGVLFAVLLGFMVVAGDWFLAWEASKDPLSTQLGAMIYFLPCALALILAVTSLVLHSKLALRDRTIAIMQQRLASQPLDPAKSTRAITVIPRRTGPVPHSLATIGGGNAQMADLKFDLSWSQFTTFNVTIDRIDQGRVGVLHNVQRDSNGSLHLELNSTALGAGDYQLTIEGLTWRGDAVPQAWATISFAH